MPEPSRHYFKELRLQQFRSLVALARCKTFSAAATALGLTRASVWQQVRALEQEFACSLLRKRDQRVELTAAGEKLVEIVAPLVVRFDSVKAELLDALGAELPQALVIAAPPNFLIQELRAPIAQLHAEFPALSLSFLERNSPAALDLLEQGEADLAVAALPGSERQRPALEYTPITVYPFTLICPRGHPLLARRRLTLADFTRHPLILSSAVTYCRQHFDTVIARAGLAEKVNVVIESNFPVMLFEYVQLGLGVALAPLPPRHTADQHPGIRLRDASALFGDEPICYVRRKGEFETPHAARFRELVTANRAPRRG